MKYSLKRFFKNLKYLARFDLKEINNRPEVSSFTFGMAERLQYAIKNDFNTIYPPLIKNNLETLQEILTTDKSLIRFGDGEYIIMEGGGYHFKNIMKSYPLHSKRLS
nr:hypothetical protein [uncultured Helicobacter sp.]